jgi:SAM-dependent methyltransferase
MTAIFYSWFFPLLDDYESGLESPGAKGKKAIEVLKRKTLDGRLKTVFNPCLCGCQANDVTIATKDRFGIPLITVICTNCGLIRTKYFWDQKSTVLFYKQDFEKIYVVKNYEKFFETEVSTGRRYFDILGKCSVLPEVNSVFDLGCGAGGVLYPFLLNNKICSGCDYAQKRVVSGKKYGLDLYEGGIDLRKTALESQDLLILSGVFEHFADPLRDFKSATRVVKTGKYIFLYVPSITGSLINENPWNCIQNFHSFQFFHKWFLGLYFKELGFNIVYNDLGGIVVLRKTKNAFKKSSDKVELKFPKRYFYLSLALLMIQGARLQVRQIIVNILISLGIKKLFVDLGFS